MAQPSSLEEVVQSISPSSAGFSLDGGRAVMQFWINDEDLDDAIAYFLGDCTKGSDGRLVRALPAAHPRWPFLYCSTITDIRGYVDKSTAGGFTLTAAEDELEAPSVDQYALFPLYKLTCEFTPRPYAVLADDSITVTTESWTLPDGSSTSSKFTTEWQRFTDWELSPQPELVTAQQGRFVFRTSSGDPNNKTFPGRPRITIPAGSMVIRWYAVPYSYVLSASSYLVRFIGHVNQFDFYGFEAGNILYEGVRVLKRYPPVLPALTGEYGAGRFEIEKLCDLELQFKFTERTASSPPSVSNSNWIVDGFNCHPWWGERNGKFWYASARVTTASKQCPVYASFPADLLFTDPDVS